MNYLYAVIAIIGLFLAGWARWSLPEGTPDWPTRITHLTEDGPYRWLHHPMYVGTILLVTGLGGLGGGFWNALALFTLSELVMREWAHRERPGRIWP